MRSIGVFKDGGLKAAYAIRATNPVRGYALAPSAALIARRSCQACFL
jgi:hypothetical protein